MKFRPLGDRVVVRRVQEDQKTAGGIIIPDTAQEKPQEGVEVISGRPRRPRRERQARSPPKLRPAILCCSANGLVPK